MEDLYLEAAKELDFDSVSSKDILEAFENDTAHLSDAHNLLYGFVKISHALRSKSESNIKPH
jgi:hypothetical protein